MSIHSACPTTHLELTLNLLTTTIVAPPSNASKWQMGFNSAFKGLTWHQGATKKSKQHQNTKCPFYRLPPARQFHRTERLHRPGHIVTAAVLRATMKETRTCPEGPRGGGEWRYGSVLYATVTPSWNNKRRRLTSLRKLPVSLIFFYEHKDEK